MSCHHTSLVAKAFFLTKPSATLKLSSTRTGSSEEVKAGWVNTDKKTSELELETQCLNRRWSVRSNKFNLWKPYFPDSLVGSGVGMLYLFPDRQTYRMEWAHHRCTSEKTTNASKIHTYKIQQTHLVQQHPRVKWRATTHLSRSESGSVWGPDLFWEEAFGADGVVSLVSWRESTLQVTELLLNKINALKYIVTRFYGIQPVVKT